MIKKITATISAVTDLSETAREVELTLSEPLEFLAGCFVNVFMKHEEKNLRRAYSISSNDRETESFSLTIRRSLKGEMSPLFWREDIVGTEVEVMGPLGLNTADKMLSKKIFLFGFGVGAGVVKSLAEHFATDDKVTELVVMTGSRTDDEVIYKDWFDALVDKTPKLKVAYIVTDPAEGSPYPKGFIQDHIAQYDFNQSDVYVCGQEVACNALQEKVKSFQPDDCKFFVEAFH